MEQRYRAVLAVVQDGWKVTEVAERLGVSRQTIHNWIVRYEHGGLAALTDRSRRPNRCPHQTDPEVEALICELRREHRFGRLRPSRGAAGTRRGGGGRIRGGGAVTAVRGAGGGGGTLATRAAGPGRCGPSPHHAASRLRSEGRRRRTGPAGTASRPRDRGSAAWGSRTGVPAPGAARRAAPYGRPGGGSRVRVASRGRAPIARNTTSRSTSAAAGSPARPGIPARVRARGPTTRRGPRPQGHAFGGADPARSWRGCRRCRSARAPRGAGPCHTRRAPESEPATRRGPRSAGAGPRLRRANRPPSTYASHRWVRSGRHAAARGALRAQPATW